MTIADFIKVFAVGGIICVIAQILIDKTPVTGARIMVSYVVLGVLLTGIGVYQYVVDFAGSGATVPIIGFGYTLAKSTKEAIDTQGAIGIFTGGLTGTAGGVAASVFFALIWSMLFKSRQK